MAERVSHATSQLVWLKLKTRTEQGLSLTLDNRNQKRDEINLCQPPTNRQFRPVRPGLLCMEAGNLAPSSGPQFPQLQQVLFLRLLCVREEKGGMRAAALGHCWCPPAQLPPVHRDADLRAPETKGTSARDWLLGSLGKHLEAQASGGTQAASEVDGVSVLVIS